MSGESESLLEVLPVGFHGNSFMRNTIDLGVRIDEVIERFSGLGWREHEVPASGHGHPVVGVP